MKKFKNLNEVASLAKKLMKKKFQIKKFGSNTIEEISVDELGYQFEWDNAKTRIGCCKYSKKKITLSKYLYSNNLDKVDELIDTILHEIAHAISLHLYGIDQGRGHGKEWRSVALQVGSNGKRCSKVLKQKNTKYTAKCPNSDCDVTYNFHRKLKRNVSCAKCCPSGYNEKYKLIITQNY